MSLSYQGKPLVRILALGPKYGRGPMYFVETGEITSIVPEHSIGADGGVAEIIRVAGETRGKPLEGTRA
jgi:hypothetical protein